MNTRRFILFSSILQIFIKCLVCGRHDLRYLRYSRDQNNISAALELPFQRGKQTENKQVYNGSSGGDKSYTDTNRVRAGGMERGAM